MIAMTKKIPTPIPALNMSPTYSQRLNEKIFTNTIKKLRQNIEKSITDASFLIDYYNKYKISLRYIKRFLFLFIIDSNGII